MSEAAPRIGKIVLRDFRFFPGNETYTFDLGDDGKNLLLFGENGCGKSSLFHALRLLLRESTPGQEFAAYRNIFSPGEEGTIAVELTAGMAQDFKWEYGEPHLATSGDTAFLELARRVTFLDYKALLRTSLLHEDAYWVNLFSLLVETLLRDAELPDGQTVFQHWEAVRDFKPPETPPEPDEDEEECPTAAEQINAAAQGFMSQLEEFLNVSAGGGRGLVARANELLAKLTSDLEVQTDVGTLLIKDISEDPSVHPHTFNGAEVRLRAVYAGHSIDHPALFLNEARLTAIALALYLAATEATTPSTRGVQMPRVLVLDDVLIGLDFANRLPVLRMLNEEFLDWQVILMTFDRVWFDLARKYTENSDLWRSLTLRELPSAAGQSGRPIVEPCADLLSRAEAHLQSGDLMAAAVYIRAAFEARVKNACRDHGIKVAYKPVPRDVRIDQLWEAIVERQKARQERGDVDFIDPNLMNDVETVRSVVLNRLSHSGTPMLTSSEVKMALDAVRRLQRHHFRKSNRPAA
jgi:energy-coupling factor transporter ATP-binding protein EcfA2